MAMQTSLSKICSAWLYHLPDAVTHSKHLTLTAMRALCNLVPQAQLVQAPQLPFTEVHAPRGHDSICHNKAAHRCLHCSHVHCLCKPVPATAGSKCYSGVPASSLHNTQPLSAIGIFSCASLQHRLVHVTSLQNQYALSRSQVHSVYPQHIHAQQRKYRSTASLWQEAEHAQQASRLPPGHQQAQQRSMQQPGKQVDGQQVAGVRSADQQQPGQKQSSRGQQPQGHHKGRNASAPRGGAQQQSFRPQSANQRPGAAVQDPRREPDPSPNLSFAQSQESRHSQKPNTPPTAPFRGRQPQSSHPRQQAQTSSQPQPYRVPQQQPPVSFQDRNHQGSNHRPRAPPPGYNSYPPRPPNRPPASPSDTMSAADLRVAQMGAPVYRNSKNNPKAPIIEAKDAKRQRANTEITASEVRLVKPDGTHDVLSLAQALQAAQDAGLDLVEVAGQATPPVCRLLDFNKVKFEVKVKERNHDKKVHEQKRSTVMKEMHFGANTAEHDLQVKLKKAREFVEKGHKVKCSVKYKYTRDMQDAQKALPALQERMAEFAEVVLPAATERQIRGSLSFYLSPTQTAKQQGSSAQSAVQAEPL